jgi:ribonuclease R
MKYMDRRVTGILSKHRKGFGFVIPENKEDTDGKDIYIAPDDMKNAMNQDLVSVRLQKPKGQSGSLEGIIDKILTRASSEVVGTFSSRRGYGFIIPENRKLGEEVIILKKDFNGVKEGDKVVVKITRWPSKNRGAEGKITEIISRKGEPGGDIKALIRAYKLKKEFPDRVEREASSIDKKISEEDISGRKDLRNKTIFTIDGADAKDLDDAVSIEKLPNGNYLLGVHIADVSHYVKEGKALDLEALKRGTSNGYSY